MTDALKLDLNETITAAVKARVEAEMVKALSGDEVIGQFVAAALTQPVKVQVAPYREENRPYMTAMLMQAIQEAAKAAVQKFVAEEVGSIEEMVRKALRRDLAKIATGLTERLVESARNGYGVSVDLVLKTRD